MRYAIDDNQVLAIIIALENWSIKETMEILDVSLDDIAKARIIFNEVQEWKKRLKKCCFT